MIISLYFSAQKPNAYLSFLAQLIYGWSFLGDLYIIYSSLSMCKNVWWLGYSRVFTINNMRFLL